MIYASLTHEVGREQETKEWRGRVEREAGGAGTNCPVLDVDIIALQELISSENDGRTFEARTLQ